MMTFRWSSSVSAGAAISDVLLLFWLLLCLLRPSTQQLVINVKNQGGDVLQETLTSNLTDDTVELHFQKADGTIVQLFLDFQKEVQIYRLMILSEEEWEPHQFNPASIGGPHHHQSSSSSSSSSHFQFGHHQQYQTVCFVMKLAKQDFIAADAIAKLRQKNPQTIRIAEEDHGKENVTFDYVLVNNGGGNAHQVLSSHIGRLCSQASSVYVQESDLRIWAASVGQAVLEAVEHRPSSSIAGGSSITPMFSRCKDSPPASNTNCRCALNFCVPWYPCGLKFCRGRDPSGKALTYRCGIKTCKKCLSYQYAATTSSFCPWDYVTD